MAHEPDTVYGGPGVGALHHRTLHVEKIELEGKRLLRDGQAAAAFMLCPGYQKVDAAVRKVKTRADTLNSVANSAYPLYTTAYQAANEAILDFCYTACAETLIGTEEFMALLHALSLRNKQDAMVAVINPDWYGLVAYKHEL